MSDILHFFFFFKFLSEQCQPKDTLCAFRQIQRRLSTPAGAVVFSIIDPYKLHYTNRNIEQASWVPRYSIFECSLE